MGRLVIAMLGNGIMPERVFTTLRSIYAEDAGTRAALRPIRHRFVTLQFVVLAACLVVLWKGAGALSADRRAIQRQGSPGDPLSRT